MTPDHNLEDMLTILRASTVFRGKEIRNYNLLDLKFSELSSEEKNLYRTVASVHFKAEDLGLYSFRKTQQDEWVVYAPHDILSKKPVEGLEEFAFGKVRVKTKDGKFRDFYINKVSKEFENGFGYGYN